MPANVIILMVTVAGLSTLLHQASGVSYNAVPLPTAVLLGHTATLHCSFHDLSPDVVVSWARSSGRVITSGRRADPKYPRYQVVGDVQRGEFHLRIQVVQLEDEGAYTCNIFGLEPKEATLNVVVPDSPALRGAEVPGQVGQQLELSCTSSGGHPLHQLTWYNGTEAFTEQHVNLKESKGLVELNLILRRLTKWDNGMNLTCRASQPFPEITSARESWTVLRVHYPPSVTVSIPSVRVIEGDSADLTCLVDSNPPATISWAKSSRFALPSGNIGQKTFQILRTSRQDAGTYQCTADNDIPPTAVGTVTLEVLYPPLINPSMDDKVTALQDDDDFSLNCLVDGNPKPKVTWRRKNTKLYWKNPLRFHQVRYDVEGTYQCVAATDGFPQKTKDVFVDVVGKPYLEGEGDTAMISAGVGETVRLACTVSADPLPSRVGWIWRNNFGLETELDRGDSRIVTTRRNQEMTSSLTIQNVAVKDGGSYICETTNMFGSAKRNMHLDIKESFDLSASRPMPPVPKYVYKTGTIDSGVEDLELQEMYGTLKPRPPPRMEKKWESVVGDMKKGEFHLQIRDVRLEDGGDYKCKVFGLPPKEATLTVIVPVPQPPTLSGAEVPATAGQQLELSCTSSGGHPTPQLTWYNGTEAFAERYVGQQQRGGRVEADLILRRVTKWDNGMNLTCRARQPFPEIPSAQESWAVLQVNYPPSISVPTKSVRAKEGEPAILTCLVDSHPFASITWTKHGRPIVDGGTGRKGTFRIPSTSRQDAGSYQCTADNGVLPIAVGTVSLDVLYPPLIDSSIESKVTVQQGDDDFSLECLADGNPSPQVKWWRKDTNLYWENPLRFHRVHYDIEGTYQCVAISNGFSQSTKDIRIDVIGKPYLDGQGNSVMISVAAGGTAQLDCAVFADPLPSDVEWIWRNKYGIETELDSAVAHIVTTRRNQKMTSTLTIPDVAVRDGGDYVCKTTNMFGSVMRNIRLEIEESIPNLVIITSITAGAILLVTMAAVLVIIAKRRGWICKSHLDDPIEIPTSRPMPPVPKYVYKTGTIDSGVEDLELQEMYGTLKPRPPPRMEKKWESVVGDVQQGEFHLQIQDVRLEDEGDYKCKIFGLPHKEATLTVIAPVPEPPTLRGAEVPAKAGQQLELSCTSSGGNLPPQLTWYNGTEAFTERYIRRQQRAGRVKADLVLNRLAKWDNGMNLTCRASQPFPEITSARESWMVLQVNYPPLIDPSMETKVTVQQGDDDFSLECLVDGNPSPRVKWWRKDTNLYWENLLRFHRVHYDIEGTYQCVAISNGFSQSTKDIRIDVIGKPYLDGQGNSVMISIAVGGTAQLDCAVFADPLPSDVEWIWRNKYGIETELDSAIAHIVTTRRNQKMTSTLTIPDVAVKDGGDYVCKTTNMFGSVMRNIHLEIEESIPNLVIITSITAGAILLVTMAAVLVIIAKRRGWICKSHLDGNVLTLPVAY
ncbi:hemicentin-1-like [Branchiostoma floridae x Branchiostoma japonicum]